MAGRHVGGITVLLAIPGSTSGLTAPPIFPGKREDKAYAEGRVAAATGLLNTANPYPNTSNGQFYSLYIAWLNGWSNGGGANQATQRQVQTATVIP